MNFRWTATIRFLVTDTRTDTKSFHFTDMSDLAEELDEVMEREKISWHSLVGDIKIHYNLQKDNIPISQAVLFFEGDIEQAGMMH